MAGKPPRGGEFWTYTTCSCGSIGGVLAFVMRSVFCAERHLAQKTAEQQDFLCKTGRGAFPSLFASPPLGDG